MLVKSYEGFMTSSVNITCGSCEFTRFNITWKNSFFTFMFHNDYNSTKPNNEMLNLNKQSQKNVFVRKYFEFKKRKKRRRFPRGIFRFSVIKTTNHFVALNFHVKTFLFGFEKATDISGGLLTLSHTWWKQFAFITVTTFHLIYIHRIMHAVRKKSDNFVLLFGNCAISHRHWPILLTRSFSFQV